MINIKNAIDKMAAEFRKKGFNDIGFHVCKTEDLNQMWEDFQSDGRSKAEFDLHNQNYAYIVLQPNFDEFYFMSSNQYVNLDQMQFYSDLEDEIRRRVGDDVDININYSAHDIEIQRIIH